VAGTGLRPVGVVVGASRGRNQRPGAKTGPDCRAPGRGSLSGVGVGVGLGLGVATGVATGVPTGAALNVGASTPRA
jgi:hypothetical protein